MNKLRMFFKLLLAFGFINYRVLGNTECDNCKCCKNSVCPNRWNNDCTAGCIDGYTGLSCHNKCSDNCESCHQYSASYCLQCIAGYYIGLINDQWINNCTLKCPDNCSSCQFLSDIYCSSCKDGFYSGLINNISYRDCRQQCYSGCKACTSYDVCIECKDGYFGHSQTANNCSEKCRPQCKTCTTYDVCSECLNGFYGPDCQRYCSNGCIGNNCNKDICSCDCETTYWGQKCEKTCSKGCVFSACFNETGECTSGCEVGYTGDMCDLCDTGFTNIIGTCTNCADTCEECSEKGLCIQCKEKYGGIACQTSCPDNCRSCVSQNMCTECIKGHFDETCSSICPANCHGDTTCSNNCTDVCDRQTGECDKGCKDNFWGRRCEKACSRNCKDVTGQNKCAQSNGHCLAGCIDGYFTEQCDKKCSSNCFNLSCENKGKCTYCCTGDFVDDLCLQAKNQMTDGNGRRAAIIGGSVSGALIMIIIIGVVVAVVFLKRRVRTNEESKENTTVVYCNIDNRGHLSHPETKEVETNQSHTAQTSKRENSLFAQKQSVTKSISNVYEKIVRRADSREYSTLSYDTTQSQDVDFDTGSHTASPVVAENFQTIYERPIIREDIVEYSRLEQDTSQSSRGYDNEEKQQNKCSVFGTASAMTESEDHNYYNTDIVNGVH